MHGFSHFGRCEVTQRQTEARLKRAHPVDGRLPAAARTASRCSAYADPPPPSASPSKHLPRSLFIAQRMRVGGISSVFTSACCKSPRGNDFCAAECSRDIFRSNAKALERRRECAVDLDSRHCRALCRAPANTLPLQLDSWGGGLDMLNEHENSRKVIQGVAMEASPGSFAMSPLP